MSIHSLFVFMLIGISHTTATFDVSQSVSHVNRYRQQHSAPPVSWSAAVADASRKWAGVLSTTNSFKHSVTAYGENLAMFWVGNSEPKDMTIYVLKSVDMWYDEVRAYDFRNPGFSMTTGHFTQLVWTTTREIGVGVSYSSGKVYVVMNFNPPGNFAGLYSQSVLPLANSPIFPNPPPIPVAVPLLPMLVRSPPPRPRPPRPPFPPRPPPSPSAVIRMSPSPPPRPPAPPVPLLARARPPPPGPRRSPLPMPPMPLAAQSKANYMHLTYTHVFKSMALTWMAILAATRI